MKKSDLPQLDYTHLIQYLPERFAILHGDDPDFTIADASTLYADMVGRQRSDIIGEPFFAMLPELSLHVELGSGKSLPKLCRQVIQKQKPVTINKLRYDIRTPDSAATEYWWRLELVPLVAEHHATYIMQIWHDITTEVQAEGKLALVAREELKKRKRLEGALVKSNEQLEARVAKRTVQLELSNANLERSNRELQDFAYVASHDLQEPLRKIQAFGNLLEAEHGEDLGEGKLYLERMRSAASRMSILIEDLLAFSRVTTQARPFATVDLTTIASEVVSDLETRIADTNGTVELSGLPEITGDAVQLRQLLQNLIANALKFHRPDIAPLVKVSSTPITTNGTLQAHQLQVSDNGIGFDEKYLDRIFAVFQRLHGHDTYEGTGIGLAVCRKIVERHGGTITANSRVGEGSTFTVILPADPSKQLPKEEQ